MKSKLINKVSLACLSTMMFLGTSCNDMLEEEPRTTVTPAFFESAEGIRAGLTAGYSGFRYYYGTEGGMTMSVFGTDEFTDGRDGGAKDINRYGPDLNAQNGMFGTAWNRNYTYINTLSGVIDLGPNADLPEAELNSLIAEAKYLRAHYFFILTQLHGAITLDQGSGQLRFNTTPSTDARREALPDVYAAIISDLLDAIEELPDTPGQPGRASQGAARHLLAKVYLTKATTDAAEPTDYARAYEYASGLIENGYGHALLENFGDVHAEGNEDNSEILWTVQRTPDAQFNDFEPVESGLKENRSIYFFRPLYESVQGLQRTIEYGRPWLRYRPNDWLLATAFAERENDSRYDHTFQTVWLANQESDLPEGVAVGDTALWMPGYELSDAEVNSKPYRVVRPSEYDDILYPSLNKYNDGNRPDIMAASVRPFVVHKLSETYLIAAEAAMYMGNMGDAANYINVLRERAAFRPENTAQENAAAAQANRITAGDIDIDFILDERSRELAGEQMRWFDLSRTNKLVERVRAHNPRAAAGVQDYHVLRPIPQQQIDLTTTEYPQNPGY